MAALGFALKPLDALTGTRGTAESVGMTISLLIAHGIMLGWLDPAGWQYVRMHREAAGGRALGAGFGLGVAPIGTACLFLFVVGWLAIQATPDGPWWRAAIGVSLALLPAAFYEELLSRGYVFSALTDGVGRVGAIAITSLAFGLLHMWNPGRTPGSIANVVLAGVFLAAVLLVTRSLYAATMAHFGWNWLMAVPLHVRVSGLELPNPDYETVETGPDWVTGGAWGPEGGAAATAAMILALVLLYLWGSRREAGGSGLGSTHDDSGEQESSSP